MKKISLLIIILLLLSNYLNAETFNLSGIVIYKNGDTIHFNSLSAESYDYDIIRFSADLNDMKRNTGYPPRNFFIKKVEKIEFIPFTKEENEIIEKGDFITSTFLKANVEFIDNSIEDSIFIKCGSWRWESQNQSGEFCDPNIVSITIINKQ